MTVASRIHRIRDLCHGRARYLLLVAVAVPSFLALGPSQMVSANSRHDGTVLFLDRFTNPNDQRLTFFNRTGLVTGGKLWINGSYVAGSIGRDGWALTHVGDQKWTNYSFTVTYGSGNRGGSPSTVHMATAYVRVAAESGNSRQTMYRVDVWDPGQQDQGSACGTGVLVRGEVDLSKYVKGAGTDLKTVCLSNSATGTNSLTVVVNGPNISVAVDGFDVLKYTDPAPIRSGGVGLGDIWETNGWFDNAVVRTLG